jgi:hypothetical protein
MPKPRPTTEARNNIPVALEVNFENGFPIVKENNNPRSNAIGAVIKGNKHSRTKRKNEICL